MTEVALRWVSHHSLMKREFGDAVLIGASSLKHIEQVSIRFVTIRPSFLISDLLQNLVDLEKGPLRRSLLFSCCT